MLFTEPDSVSINSVPKHDLNYYSQQLLRRVLSLLHLATH